MVVASETLTFDYLLTRSALLALAAALVWILVVLTAIAVEAVTQGRFRMALALGCPRACHRWLLGLLSVALAAAVLSPPAATAQPAEAGALDGLPLPDRPVADRTRGEQAVAARAHQRVRASEQVTVHAGQSLWEISRSRLPPDASTHRIAALTRSLYRRNRDAIGENPDLIRPGQSLAVSPTAHETYSEDS